MVTGPVVWVDGGGAVVVVFSGFSLAQEVRWGIRILRCGLVDVRLLKFLAPPGSGFARFDSALALPVRTVATPAPFGPSAGGGAAVPSVLFLPLGAIQCWNCWYSSNRLRRVCVYRANKH